MCYNVFYVPLSGNNFSEHTAPYKLRLLLWLVGCVRVVCCVECEGVTD